MIRSDRFLGELVRLLGIDVVPTKTETMACRKRWTQDVEFNTANVSDFFDAAKYRVHLQALFPRTSIAAHDTFVRVNRGARIMGRTI